MGKKYTSTQKYVFISENCNIVHVQKEKNVTVESELSCVRLLAEVIILIKKQFQTKIEKAFLLTK